MKTMRSLAWLFLPLTLFFGSPLILADEEVDSHWPREINLPQGDVIIYQPQPENLTGDILTGRAAIALELKDRDQPIFGAVWFSARLDTDREERLATLLEVEVNNIRIPIEDEGKSQELVKLLETEMPKWQLSISIDNLLATLEIVDARETAAESISIEPPKIIFTTGPAVLILIDGEPQLREIEGSELQRVINTPFTILYDGKPKRWYLHAEGDTWYTADAVQGDWAISSDIPSAVKALAPPPNDDDLQQPEGESDDSMPGPAPDIVVMTEPAELISIDGKANFQPIEGTQLLAVTNTDSDLMMDIGGQNYYVLLSGRWYTSTSLDGPWTYTPGENLPGDFSSIPEESDMSTVLYAVPGTKAAEEAVLDAQMPQTAAVERSEATLDVEYDGTPTFKEIEGTGLSYAVNTATAPSPFMSVVVAGIAVAGGVPAATGVTGEATATDIATDIAAVPALVMPLASATHEGRISISPTRIRREPVRWLPRWQASPEHRWPATGLTTFIRIATDRFIVTVAMVGRRMLRGTGRSTISRSRITGRRTNRNPGQVKSHSSYRHSVRRASLNRITRSGTMAMT
jgi:hypothetical protein